MARPKKKSERELILDAQNMDEKEVLNRIEELKARYDNVLKQKKDAKIKAARLTKNEIFDDLLSEFNLTNAFEACETLDDFDEFKDKMITKIKFLVAFFDLNQNRPGVEIPVMKEEEKTEDPGKQEDVENKEE
ncbi:hypothetical protein IJ556_04450 [bacterium]|nr:hypothetical protein [Acidaminococcaceae bacterium]MBR1373684.1 hypothetical protein [bacterium]